MGIGNETRPETSGHRGEMSKELFSLLIVRWNVGGYHSQPCVSGSLAVASKEYPTGQG